MMKSALIFLISALVLETSFAASKEPKCPEEFADLFDKSEIGRSNNRLKAALAVSAAAHVGAAVVLKGPEMGRAMGLGGFSPSGASSGEAAEKVDTPKSADTSKEEVEYPRVQEVRVDPQTSPALHKLFFGNGVPSQEQLSKEELEKMALEGIGKKLDEGKKAPLFRPS